MPPIVPIEIRAYPINSVPPEARRVLNEALTKAIRQRGTYPVILDSSDWLKGYSGMCSRRSHSPEGELHIRPINSEQGTDIAMQGTYLHELSHRLLLNVEPKIAVHLWTFAALNATLLRRVEGLVQPGHTKPFAPIHRMRFYDVSDEPDDRWGWAIQRALDISAELAPLPIAAEEVAERIWRIWFDENRRLS